MKTFSLEFHIQALKEWKKLDGSIKAQFQKVLAKRLQDPRVPSAKLRGELQNAYKIKLRDIGYRLVYEVIDNRLVVAVVAIGEQQRSPLRRT